MAKSIIRPARGSLLKMTVFIRGIVLALSLLVIWQCIVVMLQLPSYLLPTPLQVFRSLIIHRELNFNSRRARVPYNIGHQFLNNSIHFNLHIIRKSIQLLFRVANKLNRK